MGKKRKYWTKGRKDCRNGRKKEVLAKEGKKQEMVEQTEERRKVG